jgi:8-oxo-dGTP pyrophosphatase MutT (NUDIX family)
MLHIIIHDDQEFIGVETTTPWSRRACRGIIEQDGKLLFSYLKHRDMYLLPGGGIDPGETPQQCVQRECMEELGYEVVAGKPWALVSEYFNGFLRFENLYLQASCIQQNLPTTRTEEETSLGLEARWVDKELLVDFLLGSKPYAAGFEQHPDFILKAIANSHFREVCGLAEYLGVDLEPLAAIFSEGKRITVRLEHVESADGSYHA